MINQEIERRVDAYRGNPQALMQRYQQSQQLIDLLALQKLKSDKEAAMRQMQLAQGQQGTPPTVAQQREQEVSDMTRQEVIEQVGQLAQAQQQAQQSKMQQLLKSGIAQAPGAQTAAQPQAMAAGGIVAFQAGGMPSSLMELETGRTVEEQPVRKRTPEEVDKIISQRRARGESVGLPQILQLSSELVPDTGPAPVEKRPEPAQKRDEIIPPDEYFAPNLTPERTAPSAVPPAKPASLVSEEDIARAAKPSTVVGLGALAQSQGQYDRLARELATITGPQPGTAEQERAIADYRALLDPSKRTPFPGMMGEEERRARIEQVRKEQQAQFDPEKMRYQNLINFFLGGAGRTGIGSVLGGAGAAGLQSQLAQEAGQREGARGIREMEEGLLQRKETYERDKYLADQAERKLQMDAHKNLMDTIIKVTEGNTRRATELALKSLEIASNIDRTDAQIRADIAKAAAELNVKVSEGELNRIVEFAKIDSAAKDRAAQRASQLDIKSETSYREAKRDYGNLLAKLDKEYNDALASPLNLPKDKKQALDISYQAERSRISREYVPFLNRYETKEQLPLTKPIGSALPVSQADIVNEARKRGLQ